MVLAVLVVLLSDRCLEQKDMKWVETYGADKVAVVKKYEESEEK